MKNKLLAFLGIFLIMLGLILSFNIFTHYTVIFVLGWMFLMMFLNEKYFKNSNFNNLINKKFFLLLLLIGTFVTLIIELFGAYITPAWVYSFPFFNFKFDFWFSIGAYIFYIPATFETFTFFSNLIKTKTKKVNLNKLSILILIVSFLLISVPFIWSNPVFPGLLFCFFMAGFFLIIDFLNYKLNKNSVIINFFTSLRYVLVIGLTSLVLAVTIEYTNIIQYVWTYINIPYLDIALFGVPVIVLIGWVGLAALWINIYNIIFYFSKKL